MIFWDSSALARCYAPSEPGHARARNLLQTRGRHFALKLIRPEVASAIVRRLKPDAARAGSLLAILEQELQHFDLVSIEDAHLDAAVELVRKHALRGADALHLAAALAASRDYGKRGFRFVSCDRDQAGAAKARGLRVIEPV